jgi:hypothetical protein
MHSMSEHNQGESGSGGSESQNDNQEGKNHGSTSKDKNKEKKGDVKNHQQHIRSNKRNWQGAKTNIGVVLGLKTERLTYKHIFEVF